MLAGFPLSSFALFERPAVLYRPAFLLAKATKKSFFIELFHHLWRTDFAIRSVQTVVDAFPLL
ncbi:hypothetical protein MAR_ORF449 [Marseillevirus marseillevirus]|uniref:Uncharacterized protein n=1 Tax=Marseillevirus marseillevirus TaxID=694581 RepID=D2XB84_GBMV|nr:hypothetical protein MAR_ORF449 [Marseillevirus marseillevirus]ADB04211.1 hypothetical protein MAR_ORF449 [Marseillevirus marseillevirus]